MTNGAKPAKKATKRVGEKESAIQMMRKGLVKVNNPAGPSLFEKKILSLCLAVRRYAMFDLKTPAEERGMPFTCVVERPDLQEILLARLAEGVVQNAAGVASYAQGADGPVTVTLEDGFKVNRETRRRGRGWGKRGADSLLFCSCCCSGCCCPFSCARWETKIGFGVYLFIPPPLALLSSFFVFVFFFCCPSFSPRNVDAVGS